MTITNTRKRKFPSRNRNGTFTERIYQNTDVQNMVEQRISHRGVNGLGLWLVSFKIALFKF